MALTINTNIQSLFATGQLNSVSKALSLNQERLASGKIINKAADDPAGLIISTKFGSQIAGVEQALKNVDNAINLVQTADKSLGTMETLLKRAKQLALDSMDGTKSTAQRTANNQELQEIISSIDRTAKNTKYGSVQLLDGTFSSKNFQIGESAGESYTMSINNMDATALTINALTVDTEANAANALTAIENASDTVSAERGRLGGIQKNSFEAIKSVLDTQKENLSAAKESIEATDYTTEVAEMNKNNVRLQVATMALQMANQNTGLVLSLLK
jgi:flagellin